MISDKTVITKEGEMIVTLTADEMYKLEKNAAETLQKFKTEQMEVNEVINTLVSSKRCCLYNITSLTRRRDNKFPKTLHPAFYTLDDLISYVKPVPKREAMEVLLRGMIMRDNFLKEEVLFLKYLDLLGKSVVSFHDLVVRDNPSANFHPLPTIRRHVYTKYKKHKQKERSLLSLGLSFPTGEEKKIIAEKIMMDDIAIDPALDVWESIGVEKDRPRYLTNIIQGYLALLWLRSIILKTGKTIVTARDLSFCKNVALVQMLIDAYKNFRELKVPFEKLLIDQYCENNSVEEDNNQEQNCALDESSTELGEQEESDTDEFTDSNLVNIRYTGNKLAIVGQEYDDIIRNCNNVLKATMIGASMMSQLSLFYRNLYTGKNSTITLVLSFLWDTAVNFFKMNEFENTPPLDTNTILYLLFKISNKDIEKHRERSIKDYIYHRLEVLYHRLDILNKEILPLLCEKLYETLHSPQILYERAISKDAEEIKVSLKFYRLIPC